MTNRDKASIKANLSSLVSELAERQGRVKHLFARRAEIRNTHPSAFTEQHEMILARYDAEILSEQDKIKQLRGNIEGLEEALK